LISGVKLGLSAIGRLSQRGIDFLVENKIVKIDGNYFLISRGFMPHLFKSKHNFIFPSKFTKL
jgi:hypothetical protein